MFPSLCILGRTLAQEQLGWAHTSLPPPQAHPSVPHGELSSCSNAHAIAGHPAGGPPLKCLPALARSRPGHGAATGAGLGPRSPALRRSDRRAPAGAARPLPFGRTLGRTPLRAPPHSRRTHTPLSGQGLPCRRRPGVVRGAQPGLPPGLRRPPRPAPPLQARRAERAWGCKVLPSVRSRLCVAPDYRDRWPYRAPGCAPRSAPRPARISGIEPRLRARSACPPAAGSVLSLLCVLDLRSPPPRRLWPLRLRHIMARGPARMTWDPGPNSCRCCRSCCCCCSGTRTATTRPPLACPARGRRRPCRGQEPPAVSRRRGRCTEPRRPGHGCCPCSGFMRNTAEGRRPGGEQHGPQFPCPAG